MKLVSLPMKHYVDAAGNSLGSIGGCRRITEDADGAETVEDIVSAPPAGAIEVPVPPPDGRCTWNGSAWSDPPPPAPSRDVLAELDALGTKIEAAEREIAALKAK